MAEPFSFSMPSLAPLGRTGLFALVAGCHLVAIAAIAGRGQAPTPPAPQPVIQAMLLAPAPDPLEPSPPVSPPPRSPAVPRTEPASPPVIPERMHPAPRAIARTAPPSAVQARPRIRPKTSQPVTATRPAPPPALALARPARVELSEPPVTEPPASPAPLAPPSASPALPQGEATTPIRIDVAYRSNPAPRYPLASRRLGEQGTVILRVEVTADGTVSRLDVGLSSGSDRLDRAALATVANWRFEPARRGHLAVAAAVEVPIIFRLEN